MKSFKLLQLPCTRALKDYIHSNCEEAGKMQQCLKACHEQYEKMVEMQKDLNCKTVAFCEGVLIFDEGKVGLGLQWSIRNNEFTGHAMNSTELSTLHDVFEYLDQYAVKTSKTTYILQSLWRDLSSDYDILGPYYTSSGGLKSKFFVCMILCGSSTNLISISLRWYVMEPVQT